MSKFANSWGLFKSTLAVIGSQKKLLVFPALTFVFTLGILVFFIGPVALQPTGHSYAEAAHWKAVAQSLVTEASLREAMNRESGNASRLDLTAEGWAFLVMIYFASMFLATFFNVAFYHEILKALRGEPVSLRAGLRFAGGKIPAVFLWSLLVGLVGFLIKVLEERLSLAGKIIARLVGMAWSVASVFVIPVMVENDTFNPVTLLQSSAASLRKTWGEALIGFVGLQFGGVLVLLWTVLLLAGGAFVSVSLNAPLLIAAAVPLWLLGILVFAYLHGVAGHVYRCALYVFSTTGTIPAMFTRESMDLAWKRKKT
jgi:hypothetical protein